MERPEIVQLFYSALLEPNDVEPLSQFLSPRVEWILSPADPQTLGEESPPNAIKFSGKQGFQELALYLRESLHVISGDITGCIPHHHLVFSFGRVRLRTPGTQQVAEANIAARVTFVQYARGRGEILNVRHEYAKKGKAAKDVKRRQARGCSYRRERLSGEFLIDSF